MLAIMDFSWVIFVPYFILICSYHFKLYYMVSGYLKVYQSYQKGMTMK